MSATDSENEYESADEDTDKVASTVNTSVPGDSSETVKDNSKEQGSGKTLDQVDEADKSEKKSSAKSNQIVEPKVTDEKNINLPVAATEKSHQTSKLEQKNTEVINVQPKRVTLRLEKKLQRKNQVSSERQESEVKEETKVDEEQEMAEETAIPEKPVPQSSSWGFGSWGTSLLSTAAASVSTFTNQVSQGIETVLETVETSLGAPPPEDLASILKERRDQDAAATTAAEEEVVECKGDDEAKEDTFDVSSSIFTGMSSLTKVLESTGTKVIRGGLDTLELIGKKTIDILTEGDPGLRQKRSIFSSGTTLSQILREAKEKTEEEQANLSLEEQEELVHFMSFFDDYQGLVHLEALEMLSSQCQTRVQRALMVSGDSEIKLALEKVNRICEELPSVDETPDNTQEFDVMIEAHIKDLQLFSMEKIKYVQGAVTLWLTDHRDTHKTGQVKESKAVYRKAISSLAEFTATCVEQFHKFGELLLVQTESKFDAEACSTHLTGLTSVLCIEIGSIAAKYCNYLNSIADECEAPDCVTGQITNIYLEASNSTTYLQDAFQLLVPVLQSTLL